jgi:hypothetical protein
MAVFSSGDLIECLQEGGLHGMALSEGSVHRLGDERSEASEGGAGGSARRTAGWLR